MANWGWARISKLLFKGGGREWGDRGEEKVKGASTRAAAGEARAKRKKEVINKQTKANKMCRKSQEEEEKQKEEKGEAEVEREKVEKFSGDLRDRKENCIKNANTARKSEHVGGRGRGRRRAREGAMSGWLG